jgi:hypothetical protein
MGRFSRVLLSGALLAALSGCGSVSLADEWPAFAEPTGWEPKAGDCSSSFYEVMARTSYKPMNCTGLHMTETVHIGRFIDSAAAESKPPVRGSTALLLAWAECDAKTTEFLGGQWRDARITIGVSIPSTGNWESGARWFRCEAASMDSPFGRRATTSKSLKGELAGNSTLRVGCFVVSEEDDGPEVACDKPHQGEYVGSFPSKETRTWHLEAANKDVVYRKCRSLVAAYVGVPDDRNLEYRTSAGFWVPEQETWDTGDRSVRCFLYLGKTLTRSLKGGGTRALPIN